MLDYFGFLVSIAMFLAPPVVLVFCLIKAVIHFVKFKKNKEGKTKALVFGIVSGAAFTYVLAEALLVVWFAEGIAHM